MTARVRQAAIGAVFLAFASRAPAGDLGFELRAGYQDLTNARQSAAAVFGAGSGGPMAGGAIRLDRRGLFARLGASYFRREGERVFVPEDRSESFRLGHPLTITLVPVYLDVCQRFRVGSSASPYFGFGVGGVLFREESDVAGEPFTEERRRLSMRTMLGATFGTASLRLGLELSYARTPDAIGLGGVSRVYGETDLGGAAATAVLTWMP